MRARFVVHEHHSRHFHYDFRLEIDGVLCSWVIPKGPSMNPSEKRLAIHVEDHKLEIIDFEGIIPEGQYASGAIVIWDHGTYELTENEKDRIGFSLNGEKLKGAFTLVRFKKGKKGNEWLLIKKQDKLAIANWKIELALSKDKRRELEQKNPPCKTKDS